GSINASVRAEKQVVHPPIELRKWKDLVADGTAPVLRFKHDGPPWGGPSLVVPCVRGLYRRRLSTPCGAWLAWASIEVPACCRICSFVKVTISEAMSTSRMRLSDEVRFSWKVARL